MDNGINFDSKSKEGKPMPEEHLNLITVAMPGGP